ncbi:signal peptidase I [Bacteroidota bacterium]
MADSKAVKEADKQDRKEKDNQSAFQDTDQTDTGRKSYVKKKSALREWVDAIVFAVIAATIIRWLLLEAFTIPTPSMEKSLLVGDFLFVSKVHYGTRTPKTILQLPLTHQKIWGTEIPSYVDWIQLPQFRLPGFTSIKNNDVVVFNYPLEHHYPSDLRTNYIKRCVGIPGDIVEVRDTQVNINGEALQNPPEMQFRFYVMTNDVINDRVWKNHDISEFRRVQGGYSVMTNDETAEKLKSLAFINDVVMVKISEDQVNPRIYPDARLYPWNEDNFGPLEVPSKGSTIEINENNLAKYGNLIEFYEGNEDVVIAENTLTIGGENIDEYTFKQDYFFMMGDNRHNSEDSRFWGFVPKDHVVGKALIIWLSIDKNENFFRKVRFRRMFSLIK